MTSATDLNPSVCAEAASLQAFLNGYFREVIPDEVQLSDGTDLFELQLHHIPAQLRIKVTYASKVGPHLFGVAELRVLPSHGWRPATPVQVVTLIAQECFARLKARETGKLPEFLRAIFNSNAEMAKILQAQADTKIPETYLEAEQALPYGHWLHPTPKSRDGLTDWQQAAYAPEYAGHFRLTFFAAHHQLLSSSSACGDLADLIAQIPGVAGQFELTDHERLIPAHPLQAQALLLRSDVQTLISSGLLRYLGEAGCSFSATSSMRTVYAPESPWMLKFSIPVRLTNSQRVTKRNELEVGVAMARLLATLQVAQQSPQFQIVDDPAYLTLEIPGLPESGFEVIFRDNPFMAQSGDGIFTIAALTSAPLPGRSSVMFSQIDRLARARSVSRKKIAVLWFDAYLDCMLLPILALYDRHGIALEAHQQNCLLDLSNGLPGRGYYRDNQGYFIAEDAFDRLSSTEPSLSHQPDLVFSRSYINSRLAYYLVVNQIFAVIYRLGVDGLSDEDALLLQLRRRLETVATEFTGAARDFAAYLLTSPTLATKANLLTRLHDVDELNCATQEGLFVEMRNPLAPARSGTVQEFADVYG